MIYRFWETPTGDCLIEMVDEHYNMGKRAYMTDMMDFYRTEAGKHALLKHVNGWGTVELADFDIRELKGLGTVELEELTLTANDKSVLSRCIDKEEFDYAMLYYSDYQSVCHNVVESREFHALRNNLVNAHRDLQTWLKLQGVEVE